MKFWEGLFGKQARRFTEKDNRGTRQDSVELASSYWITRMASPKKEPFLLYTFDDETAARAALLALPCIHIADDSGRLICTEVLFFGYYQTERGQYEAILCGGELTHELWAQAKASFIQHGGRPRGDGELEPPVSRNSAPKAQAPRPGQVTFVREEHQSKMGSIFTYQIYQGPDAAAAKTFLEQNPVTKSLYYIIVETPEGTYGRDIQGIYKE